MTVKSPDWGQLYSQQTRVFETKKTPTRSVRFGRITSKQDEQRVTRLDVGIGTKRLVLGALWVEKNRCHTAYTDLVPSCGLWYAASLPEIWIWRESYSLSLEMGAKMFSAALR